MVHFQKRKLQVFVSSTFTDLRDERQAAVEAILTAGHIPAGMELFTSGDESQMEVIKQWIDESDVYLLILGGRYGSIESNTHKSYTHLEYEYALSKNKPLFACVVNDEAQEARVKKYGMEVVEDQNPQKLNEFRELVCSKMVRFWDDHKDIKISIGETLAQFERNEELTGWVRPDTEANMPAMADELARLSQENSYLRNQVNQNSNIEIVQGLRFDEMYELLESKDLIEFLMDNRDQLSDSFKTNNRKENYIYPKLKELTTIGMTQKLNIVEANSDAIFFSFTNTGRIFMNRLLYREITKPNFQDGYSM